VRISVIVPTYRRAPSLRRCLEALGRQRLPAAEILVVARPEDRATHELVEQSFRAIARVVPVAVPPGRPGFVAALNAGIDAATGELIAFTDDDAEPHPDWIERLVSTFSSDPQIGAVGGRDWLYVGERLQDGAKTVVGRLSWFGRLTGNHHLGVGDARDVDILKGVNLTVRAGLARQIRFDTRLRGVGTEHHSELGMCFTVRRLGYRVVYDPAIAVEHHTQPRVEGQRELQGPLHARNAAHNETLAVMEHLPRWRQPVYIAWMTAVGTRIAPGLAQTLRFLIKSRDPRLALLRGAQAGRLQGVHTYLRSKRGR
jgi:GT2 family glycosyltransferase